MKPSSTPYASSAVQTASPGRIEFIGNHTDYNGGQVLGVALNLGVTATAVPREDDELVFSSDNLDAIYTGKLGSIGKQDGKTSWANYPLGVIQVLAEAGYPLRRGLNLSFASDLPTGAGLSSSAAIELATLEAVCAIEGIDLPRPEKVLLAQRAENTFVGVPCGMLDQAVSCYGDVDRLVRIDCAITDFQTVPLPSGLHFWIFNTHHKHSLVDSLYAQRHAECREALERIRRELPELEHLAHAPIGAVAGLPEGSDLRKRAEHVIEENQRVIRCVEALDSGDLDAVGELLFASHESSRRLFENSIPELDTLVELLGERRGEGVIGARLTGGGFGGAAMALTRPDFSEEVARAVLREYRQRHPEAAEPECIHVTTGPGTRRL